MNKIFSTLLCFIAISSFSQIGRDGAAVITVTNTLINNYTSAANSISAGSTTIAVTNSTFFAAGDLIYIIQMQGATLNTYPEAINPTNFKPDDFSYGKISNYNNAGRNEYAEVFAITGNTLTLSCPLKYNYTLSGKIQVVWVPRYTSLTVNSGGSVTCPQWNGSTGGVIAMEVTGNITVNSGGKISASGLGFRGGMYTNRTVSNNGGGSWGSILRVEGAYKGESIAGDTAVYRTVCGLFGKAAPANGGGGGTVDNAGGGGGANAGDTNTYKNGFGVPDISVAGYITAWNLEAAGNATIVSSGGGRGGYTSANSTSNPLTVAPGNSSWSADNRRVQNGLGGRPLDYNTGRLFFGGGGGAGESNNNFGSAGGNGGGIINIISYGTISGSGEISANGQNGFATNTASTPINECSGRDGAGGAGGGGAIYINSNGAINTVSISAAGGTGGNAELKSGYVFTNSAQAYGPGGGGGGGYIGITSNTALLNANGGGNGIFRYLSGNENSQIDNLFPANGATSGGIGKITNTITPNYTLTTVANQTICVGNTVTLSALSNNPSASINWYNSATGGTLLASGTTTYSPAVFNTPGTYTLYAGSCPGTYRKPISITVNSGLTISVNNPTICAGQSVVLSPTSTATSYTWSTTQTTNTISVAPVTTTIYTVTGINGSCTGTQTATVTVGANVGITVNSPTICIGASTLLTAAGATTFTWSTGAITNTISVNPATTTIYTVTGSAGTCTGSATSTVTVNSLPVLTVTNNPSAICAGGSSTLTVSGATTYTWSNSVNGSSQTVSPSVSTTYSVSGTSSSGCTGTASVSVTVVPNPTITVNNPTICSGQSATLTASGAASYTWSTGQTSSTISVSPGSTTSYTVAGLLGSCSSTQTAIVTTSPAMLIAVNNPTICAGQTVVLTPTSSATSYTWSTGQTTSTISASPAATTVYTVVGSAGTCAGIATSTITVNALPVITLTANPATLCSGQSTSLTASGATTYSWSNGSNTSSQTVSPTSTTVYSVTGSNGNGCISSVPVMLTVNVTPTPTVTVNSATICPMSFATLTANGATSYTWSTGAGTSFIHPAPSTTTQYTVTGYNGSCMSSAVATVVVLPEPSIVASVNTSNGCAPLCVQFTETTASPTYSVQYNYGDGNSGSTQNPNYCYATAGTFTASVTITEVAFGCMYTYVLPNPIFVYSKPTAAFTIQEGTIVSSGSTVHLINSSSNATTYNWTLCNATSSLTDVTFPASDTGSCCITLIARSNFGCYDTLTQCITVANEAVLSIPNVFTPNNDSKNDVFRIGSYGVKSLNCTIYDRWGIKMYDWDDVNGFWDGKTTTGVPASDGSYFFIINYTDSKDASKTEKGFLSLFRD